MKSSVIELIYLLAYVNNNLWWGTHLGNGLDFQLGLDYHVDGGNPFVVSDAVVQKV